METAEVTTGTKWGIDPAHTEIAFKVKHLMITNVKGVFNNVEATICAADDNFNYTDIEVKINPASVNTGDEMRDTHLKSADFFDVYNHKLITFKATINRNIIKGESFEVAGDLTIKGITKRIKLDAEFGGIIKDPWGNHKAGFAITGKINRKDWGLMWNVALETGGVLVGDEVKISCDIQLARQ